MKWVIFFALAAALVGCASSASDVSTSDVKAKEQKAADATAKLTGNAPAAPDERQVHP